MCRVRLRNWGEPGEGVGREGKEAKRRLKRAEIGKLASPYFLALNRDGKVIVIKPTLVIR